MASKPNTTTEALFRPLKVGRYLLKHRLILAPLTRFRSPAGIPDDLVVEYYRQRASDGGLLITEGLHISVMSGNFHNVPGIYTPEQVRAWHKVTGSVHAKGGIIFAQLWHVGRCTVKEITGGRQALSSTNKHLTGESTSFVPSLKARPYEPAMAMSEEQIQDTLTDYAHASRCAIEAGFDGIEIHAANGYLLDQFICDNINDRTDEWGGSLENRIRFPLAVIDTCSAAIGSDRVAIRISPFGVFQGTNDSNPVQTYSHFLRAIGKRGLAFVEILEPRTDIFHSDDWKVQRMLEEAASRGKNREEFLRDELCMKPFRQALMGSGIPLVSNGGWNADSCFSKVGDSGSDGVDAVTFGRYFISNPDLPERIRLGKKLSAYDRDTFYTPGPRGYTDYSTWET